VKNYFSKYRLYIKIALLLGFLIVGGSYGRHLSAYDDSSSSFSLVILPDAQEYTNADNNTNGKSYNDIFKTQTNWIMANRTSKNIAYVLQEGDITNQNNFSTWPIEWQNSQAAMSILNGANGLIDSIDGVPYAIAPGNHDGEYGNIRNTGAFNSTFPQNQFSANLGGVYETNKIDNAYYTFRAGGRDWLILTFEFGPRQGAINWAKNVISSHPNHIVIIVTHAYLYTDSEYHGTPGLGHEWTTIPDQEPAYSDLWPDANDGIDIWNQLVSKYSNIRFVFCGHILGSYVTGATGFREETRADGSKVYQMLANYQTLPEGGSGYLRLLTINTATGVVDVKTYSPYLNNFLTEGNNQFVLNGVSFGSGSPAAKTGDLNNDGLINVIDLGIFLSNWGSTSRPSSDLNSDGYVNVIDLGILLSNWS
jgi:hypothetical protein